MADDEPSDERSVSILGAETRVEVRNAFDGSWSRGFSVVDHDEGRYRLRRRSDGAILPETLDAQDVREERSRSMWWV